MDDMQKLKNELASLKEQFKKKCEKLKKANEKIRYLAPKHQRRNVWQEARHLELSILKDLTDHLDKFIYKVTYKYEETTYSEPKVESFGTKWLKRSLLMHLAHKHDLVLYDYEVKIISAEKLW
jgi:hypothetical protein